MKIDRQTWGSREDDFYSTDLELFHVLERERVLEVLRRDKALRTIEAERIKKLRTELQNICGQGAKSFTRPYGQRSCARCQRLLGKFWDCGSVCCGCSHRICNRCRVVRSAQDWKCTVCHAYREFKIKSGEWFLEQHAKKFPEGSRHETIGEKLLQSYQQLSYITVVPPTPPPFFEVPVRSSFNRFENLKSSKPFNKSMENLMVSVSTHIRNLSKSQNDLSVPADHLTVDNAIRKSQSESAINRASNWCKVPSLPDISQSSRGKDHRGSLNTAYLTDDNVSYTSEYSDGRRDSNGSTAMDCGTFENISVSGEIQVAIGYRKSCLEITIKACRNLMFGDMKKRKCHPYVKVCLLPKKHQEHKMKTSVKKGNDPVYNETFKCVLIREQLPTSSLQISVWHTRGLKRNVFLGETFIRLADWSLNLQSTVWYKLTPKESPLGGAVELHTFDLLLKTQMKFLPQTNPHTDGAHGQLVVLICDVSKLHLMSKTAYIEGILCLPGDRKLVQRTPAIKTTGTLQMNFSRFTQQELMHATMMFSLWDKPNFSFNEHILRSAQLCGADLSWQRLQQMPGVWHDIILPLHADVNTNTRS
ncbi:synaptotagmin-like protein 3 isoform X3 [Misgurnus anguillicaudatus]|uniref:synaptotagmin-like protein 3 isoform X3 n=1 Tax=Misgurnus anguillicaudatus TaxID=75329 RepID=UPI003CCF01DD